MPKTFQVSVDIVVEAGDSKSAEGYVKDLLENALAPHVHRIPASYVTNVEEIKDVEPEKIGKHRPCGGPGSFGCPDCEWDASKWGRLGT